MLLLSLLGAVSLLIWLGILLHPARPWDFWPVGDDDELLPEPFPWPSVCVLVPARNESESLPRTLPALLSQEYPGDLRVVVIDDRSTDGTAEVARCIAAELEASDRLVVVSGAPLPIGWVGKVWALQQGACYCGLQKGVQDAEGILDPQSTIRNPQSAIPQYLLLTDADIHHAPGSLKRLVTESEHGHLALNSRMARLRCVSRAERLLIPAFVFFFNLLYPMRLVNNPRNTMAAAAGGCVLLSTAALERIGGFACIKDKLIDDVSLAQQVKRLGEPIWLSLSRRDVASLRVYDSLATVWAMVCRTAFTQLRYSWLRLAGTIVGLTLMFFLPPVWALGGTALLIASDGSNPIFSFWTLMCAAEGYCAWILMAIVYRPAVHFFALPGWWAWVLPLGGVLYGAMTVDSAVRHRSGVQKGWRDRP